MPKKKGQPDSKSVSFDSAQLGDVHMGDVVSGNKIIYNVSEPRQRKRKQWGDPESANQAMGLFALLGLFAGLLPPVAWSSFGAMLLCFGVLYAAFHIVMAARQGAPVKRFASIFIIQGTSVYLLLFWGMRLLIYFIS